jgi:hypothetical protein
MQGKNRYRKIKIPEDFPLQGFLITDNSLDRSWERILLDALIPHSQAVPRLRPYQILNAELIIFAQFQIPFECFRSPSLLNAPSKVIVTYVLSRRKFPSAFRCKQINGFADFGHATVPCKEL